MDTSELEWCQFYVRGACLAKRDAYVEKTYDKDFFEEDARPICVSVVEGDSCKYDKCPNRYLVGNNKQNCTEKE